MPIILVIKPRFFDKIEFFAIFAQTFFDEGAAILTSPTPLICQKSIKQVRGPHKLDQNQKFRNLQFFTFFRAKNFFAHNSRHDLSMRLKFFLVDIFMVENNYTNFQEQ